MVEVRKVWAASLLLLLAGLLWAACDSGPAEEGADTGPFAASCQPLSGLDRFRYTYTYALSSPKPNPAVDETATGSPPFAMEPNADDFSFSQVYSGSFVSPDRFHIEVETPSEENAGKLVLLYIGDQAWADSGAGLLKASVSNSYPPLRVCESVLPGLNLTGAASSAETVNGLKTRHFTLTNAQLDTAARLFGQESDMGRLLTVYNIDLWLAEDGGWPVRITGKSTGTYPSGRQLTMEIGLEVKDVGADDIKIEPPPEGPP